MGKFVPKGNFSSSKEKAAKLMERFANKKKFKRRGVAGKPALKDYLDCHDLSYAKFAAKVGCSTASICMWSTWKRTPSAGMALRIQKATKNEIPISTWGYAIGTKGKLTKT